MQFLTFYTPAPGAHSGPPSKEYMDQMNKLIEESMKSGELIATGETTHVICDRRGRPKSLPEKYRKFFPSTPHKPVVHTAGKLAGS